MKAVLTFWIVAGGLLASSSFVGCSETPPLAMVAPGPESKASPVATSEEATSLPAEARAGTVDAVPVAAQLEAIDGGAAQPAHRIGKYFLAGQPAEGEFADWKAKGVRTVISLRTPGEINWDEKAAVEAQGMKFVSIPFRGADTLGDSQIEAALKEMANETNGPILLHCGTSNRVGAIWYAHRIRHDGLTPEAALAEAKQVGLRNTSLTDVIDAYCAATPVSASQ
jgi:protein tyrosine phosphatase (PTP) superfamily phosphohydrolase (DUF442 family)